MSNYIQILSEKECAKMGHIFIPTNFTDNIIRNACFRCGKLEAQGESKHE